MLVIRRRSGMEAGQGRAGIFGCYLWPRRRGVGGNLILLLYCTCVSHCIAEISVNCPTFRGQVAEGARICGASKINGVDLNPDKQELGKAFFRFTP